MKNIPCNSTHKKQYFVIKQTNKKGTVVLNYVNTNVVYLKKQQQKTQIQMSTIYSYVLQVKFPTYRPTHI